MDEILIDGDYKEGGGQILRTSLSISSIIKAPITVEKIRYNRKVPGLQNQHLTSVQLLSRICNAKCIGDSLKSVKLRFIPGKIESGQYEADSKTAGSVSLIIQATLPTLLFGNSKTILNLKGGTDADFAPPIDYYNEIVAFYLEKMSINLSIRIIRRGFFPKGGGEVEIEIDPIDEFVQPIACTERGDVVGIRGICFVAGSLPLQMAKDMERAMKAGIKQHSNYSHVNIATTAYKVDPAASFGNGSGCMLIAETSTGCRYGFNVIGKREFSPQYMGDTVARDMLSFFDKSLACVDDQMQDQILIFMALAKGQSSIRTNQLTLHSQTCIYVLEQMLNVKFNITKIDHSSDVIISCDGAAISRKNLIF